MTRNSKELKTSLTTIDQKMITLDQVEVDHRMDQNEVEVLNLLKKTVRDKVKKQMEPVQLEVDVLRQ